MDYYITEKFPKHVKLGKDKPVVGAKIDVSFWTGHAIAVFEENGYITTQKPTKEVKPKAKEELKETSKEGSKAKGKPSKAKSEPSKEKEVKKESTKAEEKIEALY